MNAEHIYSERLSCKAHPICETLQCILCWERIYNVQCWTILQTTSVVIFAVLFMILLPWTCYIGKLVRVLLRLIGFVIFATAKLCNPKTLIRRKSSSIRRYTNRRRRLRQREFLTCAILILALVRLSKECSQVVSIKAHEEICSTTGDTEACTYNEATVINLQPLQQETCLVLKDRDNHPIAIVSMKINGIIFQCQKNMEFFTRDHHLTSESIHRCYQAGSCVENACENTAPTDKIKEFSDTANNSPGYTFCEQSCGCITCDSCFFCQPSCLFYRVYAVPTTSTTYTIFTCPSWEIIVTLEVTIRKQESSMSNTIQLHPGHTATWDNLRFSLIGAIVPQLPILSSTFAETDDLISIVKPAHRGQLTPHTVGQLQCSTMQNAVRFNCTFANNACKCNHGLRKASCSCSPGSISHLMRPLPLPQVSKNFLIFAQDNKVYARTNIGSILQLHLVAEDMKITARQSNSTCTIETSDLIGCYSCIAGAELTVYCQSSDRKTTAIIECPSQSQVALCTSTGHINKLKLHFDTPSVSMNCNATCPGGTTPFTMKGLLHYVDDNLIKGDLPLDTTIQETPVDTSFLSDLPKRFIEFVASLSNLLPNNLLLKVMLPVLLTILILICFYRTLMLYITSKLSKKHR